MQNLNRPAYSSDNFSYMGLTILHGPHHGAQKSTSVGSVERSTSSLKVRSVIFTMLLIGLLHQSKVFGGLLTHYLVC